MGRTVYDLAGNGPASRFSSVRWRRRPARAHEDAGGVVIDASLRAPVCGASALPNEGDAGAARRQRVPGLAGGVARAVPARRGVADRVHRPHPPKAPGARA